MNVIDFLASAHLFRLTIDIQTLHWRRHTSSSTAFQISFCASVADDGETVSYDTGRLVASSENDGHTIIHIPSRNVVSWITPSRLSYRDFLLLLDAALAQLHTGNHYDQDNAFKTEFVVLELDGNTIKSTSIGLIDIGLLVARSIRSNSNLPTHTHEDASSECAFVPLMCRVVDVPIRDGTGGREPLGKLVVGFAADVILQKDGSDFASRWHTCLSNEASSSEVHENLESDYATEVVERVNPSNYFEASETCYHQDAFLSETEVEPITNVVSSEQVYMGHVYESDRRGNNVMCKRDNCDERCFDLNCTKSTVTLLRGVSQGPHQNRFEDENDILAAHLPSLHSQEFFMRPSPLIQKMVRSPRMRLESFGISIIEKKQLKRCTRELFCLSNMVKPSFRGILNVEKSNLLSLNVVPESLKSMQEVKWTRITEVLQKQTGFKNNNTASSLAVKRVSSPPASRRHKSRPPNLCEKHRKEAKQSRRSKSRMTRRQK